MKNSTVVKDYLKLTRAMIMLNVFEEEILNLLKFFP